MKYLNVNIDTITFYLSVIGTLTGVVSLILYFVEIFRYRAILTFKKLEYKITFYTRDSIGEEVPIKYEDVNTIIEQPNKEIFIVANLKILISNKGSKKATVNDIVFETSSLRRNIKEYEYRAAAWTPKDVIIPLDVGESVIKDFRTSFDDIEDIKNIVHEKARLIIRDNRDKKHVVNLGYPEIM